eukprot:SAG25_NODE_5155_length_695_cov_1.602349_1_plen_52_part_10
MHAEYYVSTTYRYRTLEARTRISRLEISIDPLSTTIPCTRSSRDPYRVLDLD